MTNYKTTNYYDLFKVRKMSNYYDLFEVSNMTILFMACSKLEK